MSNPPPAQRSSSRFPRFSDRFASLKEVSWDFPDRMRHSDLEAIHPYPAKFIPQLPGTVLDSVGIEPGTAILDPFVGSGTTLVECQKRAIGSVGIDLNPIACLISRVKTSKFPLNFDQALEDVLLSAIKAKRADVPEIPNLDHWFERPIQLQLTRIVRAIENVPLQFHDIFRVALSSILVRVSNQDSDTRYAAVEKNIVPEQIPTFFATACRRIAASLQQRSYHLTRSVILERDTLAVAPRDIGVKVGAVITSPPYPNAYEYWLYHKYRMFWLGYDPLMVKKREIGARAHFFKADHHTPEHFAHQMHRTFQLIDAVLVPNGFVCFVVGRSKIHNRIIDNASLIEAVASKFGFRRAFKAERTIAATRKSFNLSHANIKTETVLVLTK